jgi:hypothetical protein
MRKPSLDIGIWFPFGNVGYAFQSGFPIRGHPYTLGDPTFWTFASATKHNRLTKNIPSRRRGQSMSYRLGGIHMSHYSYLPPRIIKDLTATEGGARDRLWVELADAFNSNKLTAWEAELQKFLQKSWKALFIIHAFTNAIELDILDGSGRATVGLASCSAV